MRAVSFRIPAVALLVAVSSCDRVVTAPEAQNDRATALILSSPTTVSVVTRNSPIASQSTSAVIGALGGSLSLPGAGLKVVVPAFAVLSPTRITITAVAGRAVAYEFQPHGIRFLVPLVATQSLTGTSAVSGGLIPNPLVAGYFAKSSDLDPLGGTALVSELLGTSLNLVTKTATFPISHFSGWLIATGKEMSASDAEISQ